MTSIMAKNAVDEIFAKWGRASHVAKACGVSRQAIHSWRRVRNVPEEHVDIVARELGWKPWDVRPDLYKPRRKKELS